MRKSYALLEFIFSKQFPPLHHEFFAFVDKRNRRDELREHSTLSDAVERSQH